MQNNVCPDIYENSVFTYEDRQIDGPFARNSPCKPCNKFFSGLRVSDPYRLVGQGRRNLFHELGGPPPFLFAVSHIAYEQRYGYSDSRCVREKSIVILFHQQKQFDGGFRGISLKWAGRS